MQHFERDFARPDAPVRADQARAELPLARPHPRRRQRADQATTQTRLGKNLWTSEGKGEPVRAFAAPTRPRRGGVHRRRRQGARRRRPGARPGRAALSQQRAVARARARAVQCRAALPRLRRHALLRARRDQACARVPAPARRAGRRRRVPARRQFSAARHRRAHARAVAGRRARAGHVAVAGGVRRDAQGQGRRRRSRRSCGSIEAAREATRCAAAARDGRARRSRRPGCSRITGRRRTAQERVENLEELVNAAQSFVREARARRRRADRCPAPR